MTWYTWSINDIWRKNKNVTLFGIGSFTFHLSIVPLYRHMSYFLLIILDPSLTQMLIFESCMCNF